MKILSLCRIAGLTTGVIVLASGCSTAKVISPVVTPPADAATVALCPTNLADLISDFNFDNGVNGDGKMGGWYTYGDTSGLGILVPPEGGGVMPDRTTFNPSCTSIDMNTSADSGTDADSDAGGGAGTDAGVGFVPGSLHVTAMTFTDWGAATGVDFEPKVQADGGQVGKGTYDASKYRGISFWAKANLTASSLTAFPDGVAFVQVSFKTPYSDIPSALADPASRCVFNATMKTQNCSPYLVKFGYGYVATDPSVATDFPAYVNYKIDGTWRQFQILFADTKQDRNNLGIVPPGNKLDPSQLTGMAIQVNSDHSTMPPTANNFEIWVDDVTFIR